MPLHSYKQGLVDTYLQRGIGGQFCSAVQTLLMSEKEGLLQLVWSVWQLKDPEMADLGFDLALTRASKLLPVAKHRGPGYLAATILLASYAIHQHRVEHLKALLHSIKLQVEAQDDIDSDDEVSRRILPMSSLFIIYGAMARQENIRDSILIWDKCFQGTAHGARLGKLALLSVRIQLATPDELSRLGLSMCAEIENMVGAYMRAFPQEKLLMAEYLVVYMCFGLESFKQSDPAGWLKIARKVHHLSRRLLELGLGGYCVASFPVWHTQTLVNRLRDPSPDGEKE